MDEILASIRRIIENNEAQPEPAGFGRGPEAFRAMPDAGADLLSDPATVAAFHVEEAGSIEIEPLHRPEPLPRVELRHRDEPLHRDEPSHRAEPAQPAAQPALSLADVAARVRAASERHVASRVAPAPEPVADAVEAEAPAEEPVAAVEIAADEPAEAPHEGAALVSPDVGARVAQSFGALAEALDAGPRRSFDEIAEDMLRPMLRAWLDDNLPTLVERLVREEIERVARGPRR